MIARSSWLAVYREAQLVGARGVIGDRALDRIAGVAQIDEMHALDDAAVLHVETGNDAALKHGPAPSEEVSHAGAFARLIRASASAGSSRRHIRPARDRACEPLAVGINKRSTSASEARPPEAITGMLNSLASAKLPRC